MDFGIELPSSATAYSLLLESGELLWLIPRTAPAGAESPAHHVRQLPLAAYYTASLSGFSRDGKIVCRGTASFPLVRKNERTRVTLSCTTDSRAGAPDAGATNLSDVGTDALREPVPSLVSEGRSTDRSGGASSDAGPAPCPELVGLKTLPALLEQGGRANLIAEVSGWTPEARAEWSSNQPLTNPAALWSQVQCLDVGPIELVFAVTAPSRCQTEQRIVIDCTGPASAPDASSPEPACGDGVIEEGEACDDGNKASGDGCSSQCSSELCGNRRIDVGEECEPPNAGRCDATCHRVICGNGVLDAGEQCDPASADAGSHCTADCRLVRCGDGVIDDPEECEDGNTSSLDGCSAACQLEL